MHRQIVIIVASVLYRLNYFILRNSCMNEYLYCLKCMLTLKLFAQLIIQLFSIHIKQSKYKNKYDNTHLKICRVLRGDV